MLQYELICTDKFQLSIWIEHQYQKNAALDIVAKTVSTCEAQKIIVPCMFLSSNLLVPSCPQHVTRRTPNIWDYLPRMDICHSPIINVDGVRIDDYWILQLCWIYLFITSFSPCRRLTSILNFKSLSLHVFCWGIVSTTSLSPSHIAFDRPCSQRKWVQIVLYIQEPTQNCPIVTKQSSPVHLLLLCKGKFYQQIPCIHVI